MSSLQESQDTFDLRVVGADVEFDLVIDPQEILYVDSLDNTYTGWTTAGASPYIEI